MSEIIVYFSIDSLVQIGNILCPIPKKWKKYRRSYDILLYIFNGKEFNDGKEDISMDVSLHVLCNEFFLLNHCEMIADRFEENLSNESSGY